MIELGFHGRLSTAYGAGGSFDLPDGVSTVADLRAHLLETLEPDDLASGSVRAVIGDAVVREDHPVRDGDRVDFIPPVGGG